jgi:hypothetical protein
MHAKLVLILAMMVVTLASGCAPNELFSAIDRHCFVADWTNHHSCISCCDCKHGSCQHPGHPPMPMLQLGDSDNEPRAQRGP